MYFMFRLKYYLNFIKILLNTILIFIISSKVGMTNAPEPTRVCIIDENINNNNTDDKATLFQLKHEYNEKALADSKDTIVSVNVKDSINTVNNINYTVYNKVINKCITSYPVLTGVPIEIREKHIRTAMQVRPSLLSVFRPKHKRNYIIWVDSTKLKVLGKNSEENLKIQHGLFGHELSHIVDYQSKNSLQLVLMGIAYASSKKYMRKVEYETDLRAIQHGFGEQIALFNRCIDNNKHLDRKYRQHKRKIYLSSQAVLRLMTN